jgi:endogenous inhibitor of DNA gyrase (YacG/DUF329 family)
MSASGKGEAKGASEKAGSEDPGCPICCKPRDPTYRPFCSKRCADVDLGRWLTGRYAIPVTEEEDEDGEVPAEPKDKPKPGEPGD